MRELLGKYGFMRRGDYINNQILNQLDEHDLRIVPDFRSIWLDNHVRVELDPQDGDNFPGGQQPDPTALVLICWQRRTTAQCGYARTMLFRRRLR